MSNLRCLLRGHVWSAKPERGVYDRELSTAFSTKDLYAMSASRSTASRS